MVSDKSLESALLELYSNNTDEFIGVFVQATGTLTWVNNPGAAMFGYSDAESLLAEDDGRFVTAQFENLQPLNSSKSSFLKKQQTAFEGYFSLLPFRQNGKDYQLVRIKNTEKAESYSMGLSNGQERFQALFNFATLGILVANSSGSIILANPFACKQFGYEEGELTGKTVEDLVPRKFREKHVHHRDGFTNDPKPRSMGIGFNLFGLKKDGTEFPVEISLSNFNNAEGFFVIAFIIDISTRKQIEDAILKQQEEMEKINIEIEKLNDELEQKVESRTLQLQEALSQLQDSQEELTKALSQEKELSDMKGRFVTMASHEFRTPLSTILSSVSLLAKYTLSEEQEKRDKHIQRIKSAVNNLTGILNEFLSIGKLEDGKITPQFQLFELKEHCSTIINDLQGILKNGQVVNYVHEGGDIANLDPSLLRNILINLVSNAAKFSPENSQIEVSSQVSGDNIRIIVKDHGIGISDKDQEHLTERFFRGSNVTNIQGTGLGLHIVSKFAELMNGEMTFRSELEVGTEIILNFRQ